MGLFRPFVPLIACAAGTLPGGSRASVITPASFQPRVSRALGTDVLWTACADFNADGRADLIYLDDNSGLKLTYGQSNNTFAGKTAIAFGNSASFWGRSAVGDVNHDGRLDAMIAYAPSTVNTGRVVTALALAG